MKITLITAEWTDTGAVVSYEGTVLPSFPCPRCGAAVFSGTEHRCGDQAIKTPAVRKSKKRKKVS